MANRITRRTNKFEIILYLQHSRKSSLIIIMTCSEYINLIHWQMILLMYCWQVMYNHYKKLVWMEFSRLYSWFLKLSFLLGKLIVLYKKFPTHTWHQNVTALAVHSLSVYLQYKHMYNILLWRFELKGISLYDVCL